ncbi:precorrin-3B synthase [Amycolatopsis sp. H20-H5]|uniref:precorrin-3B synthase n=1 Tax=Amycolatopsis sp. H20-H5 TaxID=3046309 RepID=UPI002DB5813C|nr:precorrin-3B synthase [Amycolatopsis sp. H20-H5]MEC3977576.1 precorrin-3B synthase [Amycolatopsis sp. H20-H5]
MSVRARARADACPGVFATHEAADGPLARVRLPGGAITAAALRVLADCAEELGDGEIHLTSRGNVQLRAVTVDGLVPRLSEGGFLPSPSHERVRNILASPLSGVAGGLVDVSPLARRLDAALCARPSLAALPGRFLFAIDDGRGDVSGEGADLCWRAVDGTGGALLLDGVDTGLRVALSDAVTALITLAEAFRAARGTAWRVRELPDAAVLLDAVRPVAAEVEPVAMPLTSGLPIGILDRDDGGLALGAAPLFGRLTSAQSRVVAEVAERVVVTPWRSILLPETAPAAALAEAGIVVDPADPSIGVSACVGRPGCAKSRADVRGDAARALPSLPRGLRAHFSGCERRCGKPAEPHLDVLAEPGGYRVDALVVSVHELAETLVQKGKL